MYRTPKPGYSHNDYYFGLFGLKGGGTECITYSEAGPDYEEDAAGVLPAGQASAIVTVLIGSTLLVLIVLGFFIQFSIMSWKIITVEAFVIAGFAIGSLSAMGYEHCTSSSS